MQRDTAKGYLSAYYLKCQVAPRIGPNSGVDHSLPRHRGFLLCIPALFTASFATPPDEKNISDWVDALTNSKNKKPRSHLTRLAAWQTETWFIFADIPR